MDCISGPGSDSSCWGGNHGRSWNRRRQRNCPSARGNRRCSEGKQRQSVQWKRAGHRQWGIDQCGRWIACGRGASGRCGGAKAQYTQSDDEGRFRFEEIPAATRHYRIWARAGNLVTKIVQVEQETSDDGKSARFGPLQLEMTPGHQVCFTITSAQTGEPIKGANVKIGYPHRQTVTTGTDGIALVQGLMPQEYNVTIEAAGYARAAPQLNLSRAPAFTEHKTSLDTGGVVRGVVVNEQGELISDATVVYREPQTSSGFYGDQTRTADDGRFGNRFLPLNTSIRDLSSC